MLGWNEDGIRRGSKEGIEDKVVAKFRALGTARGPGMLLKHSSTLVYVHLGKKITQIALIFPTRARGLEWYWNFNEIGSKIAEVWNN